MTQKILLADDSVTIQKVIELTFMDEDYEVTTAGDGEEALDRLEQMSPDVVIADVHMPNASGFDVAKRSKQLHPGTPVLLLVGTFEPFDEDDYAASGAESYLKKPFDSQELLQRVGELLESSAAGGQAASAEDGPGAFEAQPTAAVPTPDAPSDAAGDDAAEADTPPPPPPAPDSAAAGLSPPGTGTEAAPESAPEPAGDSADATEEGGGWAAAPPQPAEDPAEAPATGTELTPEAGAEDPFPDLAAPAGPDVEVAAEDSGDDEIFSGLTDTGDSAEVLPPPDLDDGGDDELAPLMADDQVEEEVPADTDMMAEEPALESRPVAGFESGAEDSRTEGGADDAQTDVGEPEASEALRADVAPGAATRAVPTAGWQTEARDDTAAPGEAMAAAAANGGGLSDDDVDRIARRVAEILGGDVLREVAWEVVPDLAEVVIKDRLRELENQAD